MIDIVSSNENGMGIYDTDTEKAGNVLSVQLGSLEYAPQLGIDLRYFLDPDFSFQNESFRAYLVEVLASNGINVSRVIQTVQALYEKYTLEVSATDAGTDLIAR
jgi:hypothetical protein